MMNLNITKSNEMLENHSKKRYISNNNHDDMSKRFKPLLPEATKLNELQKPRVKISTISNFRLEYITNELADNTLHDDELDLKNGFLNNFFISLKSYLIKTVPCDITLLLGNGKRLNAHKLILANSSPFFKRKIKQLSCEMDENKFLIGENFYTIKLNDVNDLKMLKICIDFIYSGGSELNIETCQLYDLHALALKLELNELTKLCEFIKLKNDVIYKEQNTLDLNSSYNECNNLTVPLLTIFRNLSELNSNNYFQFSHPFYSKQANLIELFTNKNEKQLDLFENLNQFQTEHNDLNENDQNKLNKMNKLVSNNILNNTNMQYTNQQDKRYLLQTDSIKPNQDVRKHSKNEKNHGNFKLNSSSSSSSSPPASSSSSSSLSSPSSWSLSTSPVFMQNEFNYKTTSDENDLKTKEPKSSSVNGHILFKDMFMLNKIKDYVNEKLLQATNSMNNSLFEIDTIGSQFAILNKYIYPSMLNDQNDEILIIDSLQKCLENFTFVSLNTAGQNREIYSEFNRDSLIVFCLLVGENKFNNFLIRSKLNFADINALKEDVQKNLESFLIKVLDHVNLLPQNLNRSLINININRMFYLKKPANCKTIRLDQIKSSTDCFRAIVEYSRFNEMNEKPLVFTTVHASVTMKLK